MPLQHHTSLPKFSTLVHNSISTDKVASANSPALGHSLSLHSLPYNAESMKFLCHLELTTGISCTRHHSYNYFAYCSCNHTQTCVIAHLFKLYSSIERLDQTPWTGPVTLHLDPLTSTVFAILAAKHLLNFSDKKSLIKALLVLCL